MPCNGFVAIYLVDQTWLDFPSSPPAAAAGRFQRSTIFAIDRPPDYLALYNPSFDLGWKPWVETFSFEGNWPGCIKRNRCKTSCWCTRKTSNRLMEDTRMVTGEGLVFGGGVYRLVFFPFFLLLPSSRETRRGVREGRFISMNARDEFDDDSIKRGGREGGGNNNAARYY